MKTLKSNESSFGVMNFQPGGNVIGLATAGYTDADAINETCVLVGTADTGSSSGCANLPSGGGWGFLVTLVSGAHGMQTFLSYSTNDMYIRRKSSGTFSPWKKMTLTAVE